MSDEKKTTLNLSPLTGIKPQPDPPPKKKVESKRRGHKKAAKRRLP